MELMFSDGKLFLTAENAEEEGQINAMHRMITESYKDQGSALGTTTDIDSGRPRLIVWAGCYCE